MMATTMKLIAKVTLGSSASSIDFSNIPGTYTDLALCCSVRTDRAVGAYEFALWLSINGVNTNRTWRRLEGYNGSNVYSDNGTGSLVGTVVGSSATSNTFTSLEIYIPNYAGSTNKSLSSTYASENNSSTNNSLGVVAGLWSSTSAITDLSLVASGYNLVANSSAFLYGITKA